VRLRRAWDRGWLARCFNRSVAPAFVPWARDSAPHEEVARYTYRAATLRVATGTEAGATEDALAAERAPIG